MRIAVVLEADCSTMVRSNPTRQEAMATAMARKVTARVAVVTGSPLAP